ncbi:MAG: hypothetical protein E3J66_01480 [Dehalococcoidia bacterium]|nr:MAG: hypothetical protein E3J66_01480 [Dehalococcoidia bacterium]
MLDQKVTEVRREVPAKAKVLGPEQVEKWILPKAFCDCLPQDIRRPKRSFAEETASSRALRPIGESHVSKEKFEAGRHSQERLTLRSGEEFYYCRISKQRLSRPLYSFLVAKSDYSQPNFCSDKQKRPLQK